MATPKTSSDLQKFNELMGTDFTGYPLVQETLLVVCQRLVKLEKEVEYALRRAEHAESLVKALGAPRKHLHWTDMPR